MKLKTHWGACVALRNCWQELTAPDLIEYTDLIIAQSDRLRT